MSSGVRIDKIEICDFRGFPRDVIPAIDLQGKNLLIYGENGSGKSTIFHAFGQLLDRAEKQPFDNDLSKPQCLKHRFSDDTLNVGRVVLHFDPATTSPMEWHINTPRPATHAFWDIMCRTRGLLDYRSILRTHFLDYNADGINLFVLMVETLLRDIEYPTNPRLTFGPEWENIKESGRQWLDLASLDPADLDDAAMEQIGFSPSGWPDRENEEEESEDINVTAAFPRFVEAQLSSLAQRIEEFNNALEQRIGEIKETANRFLMELDPTVRIILDYGVQIESPNLERHEPCNAWYETPKLLLRAMFREELIEHPGTFLNEARLTAIALSIYLAALKIEVPHSVTAISGAPRVLVLDDVLIGLDMTHRLPVLKILEEEFIRVGWQVILLTHDRVWFEMAQLSVKEPDVWSYGEMYCGEMDENGTVIDVPTIRFQNVSGGLPQYYLALARRYISNHDAKAAALYVRTAYEAKLKSHCKDKKIQVPYDPDGKELKVTDFENAIERRWLWQGKPTNIGFYLNRIKLFSRTVLNPHAHFYPVTITENEVEMAIECVEKLQFETNETNFARQASILVNQATLSAEDTIKAACYIRTAFEFDLRQLLVRHGGKIRFRYNWSDISLTELWEVAKEALNQINPSAANQVIAQIESHSDLFLGDFNYNFVAGLTKANIDSAWNALKDPFARTHPQTCLASFS